MTKRMNVNLTPEFERFVNAKVESGEFHSPGEVVREGLRLLEEVERLKLRRHDELKREVLVGVEEADAGKLKPFDPAAIKKQLRRESSKKR